MTETLTADAGEALRTFLTAQQVVTGVVGDHVGLGLYSDEPAIRYALLGHTVLGPSAAASRYQVECWGKGGGVVDDGTADRIARAVIAAIPDFLGTWAGAHVAGAAVSNSFTSADATTKRPRIIVEVVFNHTPAS